MGNDVSDIKKMKVFLLEARKEIVDVHVSLDDIYKHDEEDIFNEENPWSSMFDMCFSRIVVAKDEKEARELASSRAACEGKKAWLDEKYTSCTQLPGVGKSRVIC